MKTYFFGWDNIKKFTCEILKIYSSKPSFFSKKRIESGISFVIGQIGMIFFIIEKMPIMTTSDLLMWAGIEFAIAGYIVNQIQKEKKEEVSTDSTEQLNS
jgi:hypothetical protein